MYLPSRPSYPPAHLLPPSRPSSWPCPPDPIPTQTACRGARGSLARAPWRQCVSASAWVSPPACIRLTRRADALVLAGAGPFSATDASTDALVRFETSMATGGVWYTDNNGLELQKRTRWARPWTTLNYTGMAGDQPVSINM